MSTYRITVAFLFVSVTTAGSLARSGSGIPGSVAFYSARDGNNEIYVMDPDASEPRRITEHPSSDTDPALSPDGRDVVFTSNRTGNNDIFVIDSRGGQTRNLTNHSANDGWARWSPNGRHIAFHSNRAGNFEIYVMDADGGSLKRLTTYTGVDMYPDWSPDGWHIVFRRDVDLYVMDLMDDTVQRLTNATPLNQMAVWSPNGRQLAFMSTRDGYPSVFVMNADGTGDPVNLTPKDPGDADSDWISRAPSWSRDGHEIYFMSSRPATQLDTEVFVMNADGSDVRRLTQVVGVDGSPHVR